MRIQCASITSTLCCAEPNSCVHVDFKWPHLHTATMAPSSDLYFSQPSYCFSSWADTWNTVCSPEKRAHCRRAYTPRPFWSLRATRNCAIQFNPDRNHLWKWIGINLDQIRIGRMCIQCGCAQTRFDPVQCALGIQCGQALMHTVQIHLELLYYMYHWGICIIGAIDYVPDFKRNWHTCVNW